MANRPTRRPGASRGGFSDNGGFQADFSKAGFSGHGSFHGSSARRASPDDFACIVCGLAVSASAHGTKHRNHCPRCLWSRHVDTNIGDRRSSCNQAMEPIAVAARGRGEWTIVHACTGCGQLRTNRVAGDDDEVALLVLALRPISDPAFPIEYLRPGYGG